jgi:hypothetical protein
MIVGGDALRWIEAGFESTIQLGEILPEAVLRGRMRRISFDEVDDVSSRRAGPRLS